VPLPEATGLGIHTTFDLDGRMRLGPNTRYVDKLDYRVDSRHKKNFCDAVRRYLPMFDCSEIEPEMAGIRPKLQEPGGKIRDFVIRDESDKGLPGFINLIGIESPGLTSSPAIAEYVSSLVDVLLI
jgi:L-2-hydroxyglutarate oxidase LhgO